MEISKVIPLRLIKKESSSEKQIQATHRVRFQIESSDVDSMAIVPSGNYAKYAERALAGWVESTGPSMFDLQKLGIFIAVRSSAYEFYSPLRYEDKVQVEAQIHASKNSSILQATYIFSNLRKVNARARFEYIICQGSKLFDGSLKLTPSEPPNAWFPAGE